MSGGADKLVRMANQIATEFEHQQGDNAAEATWDHLWHFWDPRMRETIVAHLARGGEGLSKAAAAAVARLKEGGSPKSQTRATDFAVSLDGNSESDAG